MQQPEIAQMDCLHVFSKSLSIFQQHSFPQCIMASVSRKKGHANCGFFYSKRLWCWNWQCFSVSAE